VCLVEKSRGSETILSWRRVCFVVARDYVLTLAAPLSASEQAAFSAKVPKAEVQGGGVIALDWTDLMLAMGLLPGNILNVVSKAASGASKIVSGVRVAQAASAWPAVTTAEGVPIAQQIAGKVAAGLGKKAAVAAVISTVGYVSWAGWAQKEALEPASMAVRTALSSKNYAVARKALDDYEVLYNALKDGMGQLKYLPLGFGAGMQGFIQSQASNIDAYEAAISKLHADQAAALVKQHEKDAAKKAKPQNTIYEQNALDAMNEGELKLGYQWLDKIVPDAEKTKARARVVKAATKLHKAAVAEALKFGDADTAREEAAFIPDETERAIALNKTTKFEAKVAAKAAKAEAAAAAKKVVEDNKAEQERIRALYFGSVLGDASVPEYEKARIASLFGVTPPELSTWYKKALAGDTGAAPSGAAEMAAGSVYYEGSTGKFTVQGKTPATTFETYSAVDAAAYAQQAGGKATAAGLAAGHSV
jgi:hypothetical protein